MANQPENMEYGIPGGSVLLDARFYDSPGGNLVDDDNYVINGQLPIVELYNPSDILIVSSETDIVKPIRNSTGSYLYTYSIPEDAEISNKYYIKWTLTIFGNVLSFTEYFSIVDAGDAQFGTGETRTGFAFNRPNLTSNFLAPAWGMLMTADELRYDQAFGAALVSENDSQTITDDQLNDYIRVSIGWLERELNIDILPRLVRFDNPIGEDGNAIVRTDIDDSAYLATLSSKQYNQLYIRECGYPYKLVRARRECFVKLRRRPVRDVLTANFADPFHGITIIDLMPYRIVKKGLSGICHFRPRQLTGSANTFNYLWSMYINVPFYTDLEDIFKIDYTTGYANCQDVPDDLRFVITRLAATTMLDILGRGKIAGIASRSVSLNSVSESISTTQSATSSLFGAHILHLQKEIKDWFTQNRSKYSRTMFGVLG